MPYPRFLAANALGGLVWACGTTAASYTLGTRAEDWLKESSWIGLALAVAAGVALSTIFRRRLERAVSRYAAQQRTSDEQGTRNEQLGGGGLTEDAARQPTR